MFIMYICVLNAYILPVNSKYDIIVNGIFNLIHNIIINHERKFGRSVISNCNQLYRVQYKNVHSITIHSLQTSYDYYLQYLCMIYIYIQLQYCLYCIVDSLCFIIVIIYYSFLDGYNARHLTVFDFFDFAVFGWALAAPRSAAFRENSSLLCNDLCLAVPFLTHCYVKRNKNNIMLSTF